MTRFTLLLGPLFLFACGPRCGAGTSEVGGECRPVQDAGADAGTSDGSVVDGQSADGWGPDGQSLDAGGALSDEIL